LAHPAANQVAVAYVSRASPEPWRRPIILYLGAAAVMLGAAIGRIPLNVAIVGAVAGAYANVAVLFFVGPAADARYIFPSNVLCALAIAGSLPLAFARLPHQNATIPPA
jgi:hypothetical protein